MTIDDHEYSKPMLKYDQYLVRESGMPVRVTNRCTDRLDRKKGNFEWVGDVRPYPEYAWEVDEEAFRQVVTDWVDNPAIDIDELMQAERVRYDPVFDRIDE
jgi:hypothetical protein